MAGFTALAIAGLAVATAGTLYSINQGKRAARAQRQQQQLQRRRSIRQTVRQSQILRSSAIASSVGQGSFGGSGSIGGIGAIGSEAGSAIGYASQQSALSGIITDASYKASLGRGIAGIGTSAFKFGASYGGLDFLKSSGTPDLSPT